MEDEPLDDLRAAAMTGGAAAARVVEIVVRDQQAKGQQRQDEQRRHGEAAVRGVRVDTTTTPTTYDVQRPQRDEAMRTAGVPDQARQARTTADLMNGADPAEAARSGSRTKGTKAKPPAIARDQARSR